MMFDAVGRKEEEIEKPSCHIRKTLIPMEVTWLEGQEQEFKKHLNEKCEKRNKLW